MYVPKPIKMCTFKVCGFCISIYIKLFERKKKRRFFKKYTEVKTVFTPGVSRSPRKARLESKSRGMTAGRAEIFLKHPQRSVISFEWGLMGK